MKNKTIRMDKFKMNKSTIIEHLKTVGSLEELLETLEGQSADEVRDITGKTILMYATEEKADELKKIELILSKGANINRANLNCGTALMCAIKENNSQVVQFLLDRGADLEIKDRRGDNALTTNKLYHSIRLEAESKTKESEKINQIIQNFQNKVKAETTNTKNSPAAEGEMKDNKQQNISEHTSPAKETKQNSEPEQAKLEVKAETTNTKNSPAAEGEMKYKKIPAKETNQNSKTNPPSSELKNPRSRQMQDLIAKFSK